MGKRERAIILPNLPSHPGGYTLEFDNGGGYSWAYDKELELISPVQTNSFPE